MENCEKCKDCKRCNGLMKKRGRKPKYPIIDNHKICSICLTNKPVNKYDTHSKKQQTLRPDCKDCRKIQNAKVYLLRKKSKV